MWREIAPDGTVDSTPDAIPKAGGSGVLVGGLSMRGCLVRRSLQHASGDAVERPRDPPARYEPAMQP